jgi:squalene cyclase
MHFRCFALESNPSISANIHVLGALRISGYDKKHPSVKKIINFLKRTRTDEGYWLDKWHASPYYTTSHIIILASTYDRDVCQKAIDWILRNQRADGSWRFYPESTAEETAYCIQSLCIWKQEGGSLPLRTIKDGMNWLLQHLEFPYHSLWIGKGLYCPNDVVKSAILSALLLANEI